MHIAVLYIKVQLDKQCCVGGVIFVYSYVLHIYLFMRSCAYVLFTVQVPEINKPSTRLEQGVHVYYLWLHIMNIIIVQILTRKQSAFIHH